MKVNVLKFTKVASVTTDKYFRKKLQNLNTTIKSLNLILKNFYTSVIIQLNSINAEKYSYSKILINSKSCLNLIQKKMIDQMRLIIILNILTQIKVINKQ